MSEYDDLTNADVMSATEMAEYDRDAEFAMDAADEARALEAERAESAPKYDDPDECFAEFIDGTWTYCGCEDCQQRADEEMED